MMRSSLWQKLFIALALLSGLALVGFAAWQQRDFRRGFLGYLDEVMLQRVRPLTTELATRYVANGNDWSFLRHDENAFGDIVETVAPMHRGGAPRDAGDGKGPFPGEARDGPLPRSGDGLRNRPPDGRHAAGDRDRPPRSFGDGPGDPRSGRPPPDGDRGRPPPRPGGDRGDPSKDDRGGWRRGPPDLMQRLLLVDADDRPVAGNARLERERATPLPIEQGGRIIGTLLLESQPRLLNSADIAFQRSQTRNAIIALLVTMAAALALAFALARWLLGPVRALTDATRALAAGEFARRVDARRSDELGALARDFNHMATTLEQHRDARRQWGADIAHELRTPLAILRGEIQAMQDGVRPLDQRSLVSLNAECDRLGGLIEDIYQLALADAGALEYRFETFDATDLVLDAVEVHRSALAAEGLALEARVARVAPIRADPRRLGQLIDNLLVNARRYTDAPGRVVVSLAARTGEFELVVEDSAPGVPDEALPRLFDRLYRVDGSRQRASGGAGLGLAICRAVVDAHGGRIEARPSALGGLRVVVNLPLEIP